MNDKELDILDFNLRSLIATTEEEDSLHVDVIMSENFFENNLRVNTFHVMNFISDFIKRRHKLLSETITQLEDYLDIDNEEYIKSKISDYESRMYSINYKSTYYYLMKALSLIVELSYNNDFFNDIKDDISIPHLNIVFYDLKHILNISNLIDKKDKLDCYKIVDDLQTDIAKRFIK